VQDARAEYAQRVSYVISPREPSFTPTRPAIRRTMWNTPWRVRQIRRRAEALNRLTPIQSPHAAWHGALCCFSGRAFHPGGEAAKYLPRNSRVELFVQLPLSSNNLSAPPI